MRLLRISACTVNKSQIKSDNNESLILNIVLKKNLKIENSRLNLELLDSSSLIVNIKVNKKRFEVGKIDEKFDDCDVAIVIVTTLKIINVQA